MEDTGLHREGKLGRGFVPGLQMLIYFMLDRNTAFSSTNGILWVWRRGAGISSNVGAPISTSVFQEVYKRPVSTFIFTVLKYIVFLGVVFI